MFVNTAKLLLMVSSPYLGAISMTNMSRPASSVIVTLKGTDREENSDKRPSIKRSNSPFMNPSGTNNLKGAEVLYI